MLLNVNLLNRFTIVLCQLAENDQNKNGTEEDSKTDEKISSNGQTNGNMLTNGVGEDAILSSISTPLSTNGKQLPPKAMVKPQVLTHVIEGFVIQEGKLSF